MMVEDDDLEVTLRWCLGDSHFDDGGDDYDERWRIMIDDRNIESLHHEVKIGSLKL